MMNISTFQKIILSWYKVHQRNLPWRETTDPYKILVSEIMLQQTQVSRVLPKYKEFLAAFPTTKALAASNDTNLLRVWSGLGYWRRARFLKACAIAIETEYKGKFPKTPDELINLPGIGPYTAGAVACFAFNYPAIFIDTNIRRTYIHFFFPDQDDVSDKEIQVIAKKALYKKDPRSWHYALFDYGAIELKTSKAHRQSSHYTKQSQFKGSFRSFRTYIMKYLLEQPESRAPESILLDLLEEKLRQDEQDYAPQEILAALKKDELIRENKGYYSIGSSQK